MERETTPSPLWKIPLKISILFFGLPPFVSSLRHRDKFFLTSMEVLKLKLFNCFSYRSLLISKCGFQ